MSKDSYQLSNGTWTFTDHDAREHIRELEQKVAKFTDELYKDTIALDEIKSKAFRAGRDSYQKEMSEQDPVAYVFEGLTPSDHYGLSPRGGAGQAPLIIRPQPPKEKA
jgi:hypothetical protein